MFIYKLIIAYIKSIGMDKVSIRIISGIIVFTQEWLAEKVSAN